jgi:hypothetical protein
MSVEIVNAVMIKREIKVSAGQDLYPCRSVRMFFQI